MISDPCESFFCEVCDGEDCSCLCHIDPELQSELLLLQLKRALGVVDHYDVIRVQYTPRAPFQFAVIQDDGFEYQCGLEMVSGFLTPVQLAGVVEARGGWVMMRI